MSIIGAVLPGLAGGAFAYLTGHLSPVPAVAVVVGGVIGFFVPDLLLRRATANAWTGAAEALLVYIDLVTLERLTNASATQALHNAAALSDVRSSSTSGPHSNVPGSNSSPRTPNSAGSPTSSSSPNSQTSLM